MPKQRKTGQLSLPTPSRDASSIGMAPVSAGASAHGLDAALAFSSPAGAALTSGLEYGNGAGLAAVQGSQGTGHVALTEPALPPSQQVVLRMRRSLEIAPTYDSWDVSTQMGFERWAFAGGGQLSLAVLSDPSVRHVYETRILSLDEDPERCDLPITSVDATKLLIGPDVVHGSGLDDVIVNNTLDDDRVGMSIRSMPRMPWQKPATPAWGPANTVNLFGGFGNCKEEDLQIATIFEMWVPRMLEAACTQYAEHLEEVRWAQADDNARALFNEKGGALIEAVLSPFIELKVVPPLIAIEPLIGGPLHIGDLCRAILVEYFEENTARRLGASYYAKYHRRPWTMVTDREKAEMKDDVRTIGDRLSEFEISDEELAIAVEIGRKWVQRDTDEGTSSAHIDQFLGYAHLASIQVSFLGSTQLIYEAIPYYCQTKCDPCMVQQWDEILGSSARYSADKGSVPPRPPNIWDDVCVKSAVGLPGATTSFIGGAVQSLPFGVGDGVGQYFVDGGETYLNAMNYDPGLAKGITDTLQGAGTIWGHGMQMVVGAGVAAKGLQLADKAGDAAEGAVFCYEIGAWFQKNGSVIGLVGSIVTDLIADLSVQSSDMSTDRAFEIAINRLGKDVLSKIGEGTMGDQKEYAATFHAENEGTDRSAAKGAQIQRAGTADPSNAQRTTQKRDRARNANQRRTANHRNRRNAALAGFIAMLAMRRLVVEAINLLRKAHYNADGDGRVAYEDLKKNWGPNIGRIATGVAREVIRDVGVEILLPQSMRDNNMTKLIAKQIIDGFTKVVRVQLHEAIAPADATSASQRGYEES
jgi:hypothetical protein